ncbi:serine palmitoyltransferase component [Geranomyces variabilis]|uniref:serine C-palmitoyltransferase n=1 Tax=Geranomyces variabilis TaxID=109894 RepID=A0AAD5TMA5_9FUNG|nr:serine palmitoyltransferase component [Geranomyces variabilis]
MSTYGLPPPLLVNGFARDLADSLVVAVNTTVAVAGQLYTYLPGHRILALYVRASYQNDPYRTLLEVGLIVFMVWYVLREKYKPGKKNLELPLSEKEVQELIDEWEPEPLVAPLSDVQRMDLDKAPIINGPSGPKVKLADGKERLNLASYNFLGALNQESTKEKAIAALRKYGVGTCGPCGFYGTIDVHMELEKEIARFMGVQDAIVYSQGFSTIGSVIPAFSKRGDIIVADEGVNFAVQIGLRISRSKVKYFKHNDMADLERVLQQVAREHRAKKNKPLTRRFIVAEGLYIDHGDICPLPEILALKHKYKYRLILDESFSIGVLGNQRGSGVCEHFGIERDGNVDITAATTANSVGAAGGFCCGTREIVEHQRLGGQGYVYSASLPAILAASAIEGIKYIESHPEQLALLRGHATVFRAALRKNLTGGGPPAMVDIEGEECSPVVHIRLIGGGGGDIAAMRSSSSATAAVAAAAAAARAEEDRVLQDVVDEVLRNGVLVTRAKYVEDHDAMIARPRPSIRVALSAAHSRKEVEKAASVVSAALKKVLKARR